MKLKPLTYAENEALAVLLRRAIARRQLAIHVASPYADPKQWRKDGWDFNDRHDGNGVRGDDWNVETSEELGGKVGKPNITIFIPDCAVCFLAGVTTEEADAIYAMRAAKAKEA